MMTDTTVVDQQPDVKIAQPTQRMTKGDLATLGVDSVGKDQARAVTISSAAGGVTFASMIEVMDFAKLMAVAGQAIPPAFRTNPGMCLAVTMQAIEWRMSPFAVVNKAYIVNDRIGWESQLVHAVIEARAPIVGRLRCSYKGEGTKRKCKVWATFVGEDEPHEYETPEVGTIKVKNSPLWLADVDQQLFYYGSRSWGRKWCPDVLLGIYTRDELAAHPELGRQEEGEQLGAPADGITARIAGSPKTGEGFQGGHAERELSNIAGGNQQIIDHEADSPGKGAPGPANGAPAGSGAGAATQGSAKAKPAPGRRNVGAARTAKAPTPAQVKRAADRAETSSKKGAAKKDPSPPSKPAEPPVIKAKKDLKSPADYIAYAKEWIDNSGSYKDAMDRWEDESDLRNKLAVPIKERTPLNDRIVNKFEA